MSKKRILPLILVCIILVSTILYTTAYNQSQKKIRIIYIPKNYDETNDFWTTLISGANMAADELGVELQILSPENETDFEGQNNLIMQAAKEKPDVIMLSPISYTESTRLLKEIKKKYKIPIVLIDSIVSEPIEESLIASDNHEAGKTMGQFALNYIDKDSQIAIVSHVPNASTAIEREEGFRDGLGEYESQIVNTVYCYSDFDKAYNVTVELLKEHPKVTLIAGLNEYSAVGAGKAVEDLNMTGKVHVIGFDNSISAINLLERGTYVGLIIQKPFNMGYLGVKTSYNIAKGYSVTKYVDSGTQLFTKDDIYDRKSQQELFNFLQNRPK